MDLQILVSQKGTKVVTATNLFLALGLPNHHYAGSVKKWINDVYEFKDGIRKPLPLKDFAKRKVKDSAILTDYYLSLEFAKLITLKTNSRSKVKYAQWLQSKEDAARYNDQVTTEEVVNAIELARAMRYRTYQEACERQHLRTYQAHNGGSAANWWQHRAQILGYSTDQLREKYAALGKNPKGKTQCQILLAIDKYELIRAGVIDLFIALGKSEHYARKMGDLAKVMAGKLKLKIIGDKKEVMPIVNSQLLNQLLKKEQTKVGMRA